MFEFFQKHKLSFFIFGLFIAIILGGKDARFWGLNNPSLEEILNDVGSGKIDARTVVLDSIQLVKAKSLMNENPEKYNDLQKSLIQEKTGKEILLEVGLGFKHPGQIILNSKQSEEIKKLILANPKKYSQAQKSLIPEFKNKDFSNSKHLITPVALNLSGAEILEEVGLGNYSPEEIKLTSQQKEEIKTLINANPSDYNENQKSLLK
ncbi:MAG: hypothetical protein H6586_03465 [Flavobacteriales bacterium]|nr:hypothetical protein [Flavobacteriales bacterium]